MVGHPDTVLANGLMKYTYETRGDLKKLLPTCKQPSAQQLAAAKAFQQKQQDTYNANAAKANQQLQAIEQQQTAAYSGQPQKPKSADERAMNRCITSGRLPASCTGNALLGGFTSMIGQATQMLVQRRRGYEAEIGAHDGWRLRRRRQLATRLHRRRCAGQLLFPVAQSRELQA